MANADKPDSRRAARRILRGVYLKARREFAYRNSTPVNLALQGGGALGAFTAGALIRLSKERRMRFVAISGASAGALNGAVFATGLVLDGRRGARRALADFWSDVAASSNAMSFLLTPALVGIQSNIWSRTLGENVRQKMTGMGANPLRGLVSKHVNIDALTAPGAPQLFISATHVSSARPRIFSNKDLSIDALLASACLPALHGAVEIDGEAYWDGGFTSNPPIEPLIHSGGRRTILIRLVRAGATAAPRSVAEIDSYMMRHVFARETENELTRIAARRGLRPRIEEIDLSSEEDAPGLGVRPSRRVIADLIDRGASAAALFLTAAHGDMQDLRAAG